MTLQILFSKGPEGNFNPQHVTNRLAAGKNHAPGFVQVYTLDRTSPTRSLVPLEKSERLLLQALPENENIPVAAY